MAHNTAMNERRITQRGRGIPARRRFIDFYAAFIWSKHGRQASRARLRSLTVRSASIAD
jgi:hypothetical protein